LALQKAVYTKVVRKITQSKGESRGNERTGLVKRIKIVPKKHGHSTEIQIGGKEFTKQPRKGSTRGEVESVRSNRRMR